MDTTLLELFLRSCNLESYLTQFVAEGIIYEDLFHICDEELKKIIKKSVHQKRFFEAIKKEQAIRDEREYGLKDDSKLFALLVLLELKEFHKDFLSNHVTYEVLINNFANVEMIVQRIFKKKFVFNHFKSSLQLIRMIENPTLVTKNFFPTLSHFSPQKHMEVVPFVTSLKNTSTKKKELTDSIGKLEKKPNSLLLRSINSPPVPEKKLDSKKFHKRIRSLKQQIQPNSKPFSPIDIFNKQVSKTLFDTPGPTSFTQVISNSFTGEISLQCFANLCGRKQVFSGHRRKDIYIKPMGKADFGEDKRGFEVQKRVDEFLIHPTKKVLLILGNAGSGKSLFGTHLIRRKMKLGVFDAEKGDCNRVPLKIKLTGIDNPCRQLVRKYLTEIIGLENKEARFIENNYPLLLFLDGFDEIAVEHRKNLFSSNLLGTFPDLKVIITCRTSSLVHMTGEFGNYKELFCPRDPQKGFRFDLMDQIVIQQFSKEDIREYVSQFVSSSSEKSEWNVGKYLGVIEREGLSDLIRNPFLLYITLDSLVSIVQKMSKETGLNGDKRRKITRFDMFNSFVNRWFDREKVKKDVDQMELMKFSENLAFALFTSRENTSFTHEKSNSLKKKQSNVDLFFRSRGKKKFDSDEKLLSCSLLKRMGQGRYRFIHKSVLEFFVASIILRDLKDSKNNEKIDSLIQHLNTKQLNEEISIVTFICDVVTHSKQLQDTLFDIVLFSRNNDAIYVASGNAATILNFSKFSFCGKDMSGVRIPAANLSGSNLVSCNLSRSNLENVILKDAMLSFANFEGSSFRGNYFGILPFFKGRNLQFAQSARGSQFATYSEGILKIWNGHSIGIMHTIEVFPEEELEEEGDEAILFKYHPNEKFMLLAALSEDELIIFEGKKEYKKHVINIGKNTEFDRCLVLCMEWNSDLDKRLLAFTFGGDIYLLNIIRKEVPKYANEMEVQLFLKNQPFKYELMKITKNDEEMNVVSLSWHPDGKRHLLLSKSSGGGMSHLWDGNNNFKKVYSFKPGGGHLLLDYFPFFWCPNRKYSILAFPNESKKQVEIYKLQANNKSVIKYKTNIKWESYTNASSFCWHEYKDFLVFAMGNANGIIRIIDGKCGFKLSETINTAESTVLDLCEITCLSYHPKRLILACGNKENVIRLYDGESGYVEIARFQQNILTINEIGIITKNEGIKFCEFHPTANRLYSSCGNNVRIWDISLHKVKSVDPNKKHHEDISSLTYHIESEKLFSIEGKKKVHEWDIKKNYHHENFPKVNYLVEVSNGLVVPILAAVWKERFISDEIYAEFHYIDLFKYSKENKKNEKLNDQKLESDWKFFKRLDLPMDIDSLKWWKNYLACGDCSGVVYIWDSLENYDYQKIEFDFDETNFSFFEGMNLYNGATALCWDEHSKVPTLAVGYGECCLLVFYKYDSDEDEFIQFKLLRLDRPDGASLRSTMRISFNTETSEWKKLGLINSIQMDDSYLLINTDKEGVFIHKNPLRLTNKNKNKKNEKNETQVVQISSNVIYEYYKKKLEMNESQSRNSKESDQTDSSHLCDLSERCKQTTFKKSQILPNSNVVITGTNDSLYFFTFKEDKRDNKKPKSKGENSVEKSVGTVEVSFVYYLRKFCDFLLLKSKFVSHLEFEIFVAFGKRLSHFKFVSNDDGNTYKPLLLWCTEPTLNCSGLKLEKSIISTANSLMLKQKGAEFNEVTYLESLGSIRSTGAISSSSGSKISSSGSKGDDMIDENEWQKYAFIVGNCEYQDFKKLGNAVNDANLVGSTLKKLNFKVSEHHNLDCDTLLDTFDEFIWLINDEMKTLLERKRESALNIGVENVQTVQDEDVVLHNSKLIVIVYFAGHGIFFKNGECLVPVDAKREMFELHISDDDLMNDRFEELRKRKQRKILNNVCMSTKSLLMNLQSTGGKHLLFLDACRTLSELKVVIKKSKKSNTNNTRQLDSKTLEELILEVQDIEDHNDDDDDGGENMKNRENKRQSNNDYLISYSTQPGNVSLDGVLKGKNSTYAEALCELLMEKGVTINELLMKLKSTVEKKTDFAQIPVFSNCLSSEMMWPVEYKKEKSDLNPVGISNIGLQSLSMIGGPSGEIVIKQEPIIEKKKYMARSGGKMISLEVDEIELHNVTMKKRVKWNNIKSLNKGKCSSNGKKLIWIQIETDKCSVRNSKKLKHSVMKFFFDLKEGKRFQKDMKRFMQDGDNESDEEEEEGEGSFKRTESKIFFYSNNTK